MEQIESLSIMLFFLSLALCAVFLLAWSVFDRQTHVLTWSACFAAGALHWLCSIATGFGIISFSFFWSITNLLALAAPTLALLGYNQRARLPLSSHAIAGLILIPFAIVMWASYVQPHVGIRTAVLPFQGVILSICTIRTISVSNRPLSQIEWAVISSYATLSVYNLWLMNIALGSGIEGVESETDFFISILAISVPALATLIGLLMLLIIASDLAAKVRELAENQRQRLEKESEQEKDTLQDAIDAMPDLVAIADREGKIVTCNNAFSSVLDFSKKELFEKDEKEIVQLFRELILSIDGDMVGSSGMIIEKLHHCLETGKSLNFVTHDSQMFALRLGPLSSGGMILVARDNTQLDIVRTRLETAIHAMPMGFAYFEKNKIIACNESYERLVQKDRDWIASQSFEVLIKTIQSRIASDYSPEDLELGLQSALTAIQKRQYYNRVVKFSNGAWYNISIHPLQDKGFITTATDITKRRLLEKGIEESETQLRVILGNQPFPVIVLRSKDSELVFASKAALDVLGEFNSGNQAAGDLTAISANSSIAYLAASTATLDDTQIGEVTLQRSNGEEFNALLSSHNIRFSEEAARVVSFIDISKINKLQSELETQQEVLIQSEKLNSLSDLLAGVAHELNNPLTVIVANSHVLRKTISDEKTSNRLKSISDASERCAKIIRSFLDIARKDTGELSEFDVGGCIKQAMDVSNVGLKMHQIIVEADLHADLPAVLGYEEQFTQVILNLIINAQQARHESGIQKRITITANLNKDENLIVIDITDNGVGISEADRDRIFESNFTTRQAEKGTGMGLPMARGIIKSHGGTIHLLRSQAGECTHFQILLPHTKSFSPSTKSLPQDRHETTYHSRRILIVDDDPAVANALSDVISLERHQVRSVNSANDALSMLEANNFDVILSDIYMPGLDGAEFLNRLNDKHPLMAQKIAFITGNDLAENTISFLESCGRPYLSKPFMPQDILSLIEKLGRDI